MKNSLKRLNIIYVMRPFTLIELLVIVAITVILAAMMRPVLLQASEGARTGSCAGNLKKLCQCLSQYMGDSDGHLPPPPRNITANYTGIGRWNFAPAAAASDQNDPDDAHGYTDFRAAKQNLTDAVKRYITDVNVVYCPEQNKFIPASELALNTKRRQPRFVSYMAFWRMGRWFWGSPRRNNDDPSLPLIGDLSFKSGTCPSNHPENGVRAAGANWAFLDGHVDWLTADKLHSRSAGDAVAFGVPKTPKDNDSAFGAY